jgi:hypothetical protein
VTSPLSPDELRFLSDTARYLEHPGFLMKVANLVGKPAEGMLRALPAKAHAMVGDMTNSALERSLQWAVRSLPVASSSRTRGWSQAGGPRFHLALTAMSGAVGGLFGLAGAALEIPATTTLMLRSIAEIAARNGSNLSDPQTRLECLCVFSYGSPELKAMESAYFSSRVGMALAVRDAARYITQHGAQEIGTAMSRGAAPALVRLVQQIAARFEIVVTEKLAAQAVPIAGAAMGSLINAAFTDHFNHVAEYHFGIVRLERLHGQTGVQEAYHEAAKRAKRAEN